MLSGGVGGTHHEDLQYQCLLRLSGARLQEFLQNMGAAGDAWIRKAIKNAVQPDEVLNAPPPEDEEDPAPLPGEDPDESEAANFLLVPTIIAIILSGSAAL